MNYAQWKNMVELKDELRRVDKTLDIKSSGVPITYDDENIYIDDKAHHTLVIGSTGSGKTQSVVLPQVKLAMYTNESMLIKDEKGELHEQLANELKNKGYSVYTLSFNDAKLGNNWNPLTLPYKLYKEGKVDEALSILEKVGYYLFQGADNQNADPFWTTSAAQYFMGIALFLFEKGEESEINFNSIYDITCVGEEKKDDKTYFNHLLNTLNRSSAAYINLSSILAAPTETRGGILSVFKQVIGVIVSRETLSSMLSTSDFELDKLINEKFAIFMVGDVNYHTLRLEPLFVDELYTAISFNRGIEKRLNIILDEFETLCPLYNFSTLLNSSRGLNIKFTIIIKSLLDLERQYGKENSETLKYSMGLIIYLLANDTYTQEEISKLCGNKSAGVPLITPEELKLLKIFEAVILMQRTLPIKTKLIPDYQLPWPMEKVSTELPKRNIVEHKIFDLKKYI